MAGADDSPDPIPTRRLVEWQDWLASLDQQFVDSVRPPGLGIAISRSGYSVAPRDVRDDDRFSLCDPVPLGLSYVICRYHLQHQDDPWSYLRFWTRTLRVGGVLVLFVTAEREWINPYAYWDLGALLMHLGFEAPRQWHDMEHGVARAAAVVKRHPAPPGVARHAASAELDGQAVLLDAPSACGKSSLLLRLIARGWRFLGNSVSLLDENLVVQPGPPLMSLRPGVELHVPGIADVLRRHPVGFDSTGRYSDRGRVHPDEQEHYLQVTEVPGLQWGQPAKLTAVVFPHIIPDQRPSWEAISGDEAERLLAANVHLTYGHSLPSERRARRAVLRRLVDDARLIRLTLGEGDPVPVLLDALAADAGPRVATAGHRKSSRAILPTASLLGYSEADKLLIVNADDAGLCHSANQAIIAALERGLVTSASVMVPSPWFAEIAEYARTNPQCDFGVHLTFTCEWQRYRWGPVAGASLAPGLCADDGGMWPTHEAARAHASLEEMEIEARAQINRCLRAGVDVTHLDCHMDVLLYEPEFCRLLLDLGEAYGLPIRLFPPRVFAGVGDRTLRYEARRRGIMVPDDLVLPDPRLPLTVFWPAALRTLSPGVHLAFVHLGLGGEELTAITAGDDRQEEYRLFGPDRALEDALRVSGITLLGHRQMREIQRSNRLP